MPYNYQPLSYTYLYEEEYPEPGDYDYNDLVLRVSQQRTGEKQITINVTISAVGASKMIASCIRLVGYRFQDIDSVYTTTGKSFNSEKAKDDAEYNFKKQLNKRLDLKDRINKIQTSAYSHGNKIANHYLSKDQAIPIWGIFELMTLGEFGTFVSCLNTSCRKIRMPV